MNNRIPRKKLRSTIFDIGLSSIFLAISSQAREKKAKLNKQGHIKLKAFCTDKETIHKRKGSPLEWEKISVNNISDKELIFNT